MKENLEALISQMHRGGILYSEAVAQFKRAFLGAVLQANNGNLSKTATAVGLHRNTLARICAELELDAKAFRVGRRRQPESARPAMVVKRTAP